MRQISLAIAIFAVFSVPLSAEPPTAPTPEPKLDEKTSSPLMTASIVGTTEQIRVVPPRPAASDQERIRWSHKIEREGAAFVKVHFERFNLHPGDELRVYSGSGRLIETLTGEGPKNSPGNFWSLSAFGSLMELELVTRWEYRQDPFRIDQVIFGDAEMLRAAVPPALPEGAQESICTPADFEDVICYDGDAAKWANVQASVGVMTAGPNVSLWCSGSNVSPNNYILTNYHCIPGAGSCANGEFVFRYYNTTCGGNTVTEDWVGFRCDETVASSTDGPCDATTDQLDYSLHTVVGDPASTFGFVQPDPTRLTDGEEIYIVQHPNGRPHEIAHGGGTNVEIDATPGLSVIRYFDTLDTEGGSSGSPIFRESDDMLVGLHHCGGCSDPAVGNRGMLMSDIYPEIQAFLCSDTLDLIGAPTNPFSEVNGNGNGIMEPGETYEFTPIIRNTSCATEAMSVTADIGVNPSSAAVTLLSTSASFGNIAAATAGNATAPIQFVVGPGSCGGEIVFDLNNITATAGGPFLDFINYASGSVGGDLITTIVTESFGSGMPMDWTIVDGGTGAGAAATWTTDNPGSRTILSAPFAIVDSDELGTGQDMDEELIMPVQDLTSYTSPSLRFNHDFNYYSAGGDEKADVDVRSTATGGVWTNLARYDVTTDDTSGIVEIDLTPYIAADVEIRFHYYDANFDWWWAVDDITIQESTPVCESFSLFTDGFESGDFSAWSSTQP